MLTHRQRHLLNYVGAELRSSGGIAPSVREIKRGLGVCSVSIQEDFAALEQAGAIRRLPGRARAIEVKDAVFHFNPITKKLEPWQ